LASRSVIGQTKTVEGISQLCMKNRQSNERNRIEIKTPTHVRDLFQSIKNR
jgi:hypothetical protein